MTGDHKDRSAAIAALNDRFRATLHIPQFGAQQVPGRAVMTQGIAALDPFTQIEIVAAVRAFDAFTEGNDPYGEHDFGAFDHPVAGKVFWKIDYYDDAECRWGTEAPEDPALSYRVLTIMLAEEW